MARVRSGNPNAEGSWNSRAAVVAALIAVVAVMLGLSYPESWRPRVVAPVTIQQQLGPLLSPQASIVLPGTPEFSSKTARWIASLGPNIGTVVVVATEEDIQQTIKYSNKQNRQFIAFSGGHGAIKSLEKVENGIEIYMGQLNHVKINADGQSVNIGGGTKSKEVAHVLWAAGKRTVTGICECVGITAPILGGGHGLLQGQYGLLSDQLLSVRVVLANATAVTASKEENADLFWALQGAGHNFGIVTEFTYKIYDARVDDTWAFEQLIFTGEKLEELYALNNEMMKTQPPELTLWGYFLRIPEIDPINPVIVYSILYDGPLAAARKYVAAVHDLNPVAVTTEEVSYLDLPGKLNMGESDFACQKGSILLRFPVDLPEFNITALRRTYELVNDMLAQEPAFNASSFMIEGYPIQGVQRVDGDSTAVSYRDDKLLLTPLIYYLPNKSLDAAAVKWAQRMRAALQEGSGRSELHAYVNYAYGDEGIKAWYGHEPWRLERLKNLKKRFDPDGKFSFYAPID